MCNNEIIKKDETNFSKELQNTQELCGLLMKTAHYAKMGQEGIFAIVETAKSLGIDPRIALGGGLYFVKGRVEMQARLMASLIRSKKHSMTKDRKSDDTICILHGKRSDNGDQWSESFSIQEAKRAGIYKNAWITFPRDMLYARALSRLARQLFPDVIGNCYVEGEISADSNIKSTYQNDVQNDVKFEEPKIVNTISEEEEKELVFCLDQVPEYKKKIESFLTSKGINSFYEIPKEMYVKVLENAKNKFDAQVDLEIMESQQKEIDEEVKNESL